MEKDQFVTEDDYDNDKKVYQNPFTTNKTSPPMTQMYSQKLKQHKRDRLQYEKRNTVRAMDIKSEMDELMKRIILYKRMLKATDIVTRYKNINF